MNKRLREIEQRMLELRGILTGTGECDMDAIEKELNALEQERSAIQRRQAMLDRLNAGQDNPMGEAHEESAGECGSGESRATAASPEYRNAWALYMMGGAMNREQRDVMEQVNPELRDFTHTTENTAVLIPETVVAGIWKRAAENHPLWAAVRKFAVKGTLTMKKHTGITAGDAAWYDEPTPVADEQNAFAEISLTGCELAKSVTVSWKLRAMAVADFIPFIEAEIGERMGAALGTAVYSGRGKPASGQTFKPEPRGIKTALLAQSNTPQVVTYTAANGITDTVLRTAMAKVHSSLQGGVVIYCNNATAWTILAEIKDTNKRPIFLDNNIDEGAVARMLGKAVRVDDAMEDGEVLFANAPAGYWANVNQGMTMHTEEHVKARETDYMGYAIVDGDVYDEQAFALVMQQST